MYFVYIYFTFQIYISRFLMFIQLYSKDVEHLKRLLPNLGQYRLISNFNHIDFTYGRNTRKLVYNDIVKAIETVQ